MKRSVLLTVTILLFSAFLYPAASAEGGPDRQRKLAAPSAEQAVSSGPLNERPKEVRRYWTKARMREAQPAPGPSPRPSSPTLPAEPRGSALVIEPSPGETTERAAGAGVDIPFVRTEVVNTADAPYRTHGKVFFTWKGGDYVCSGTVVTSASESLIVTAGHCVFDEGVFSSNFMFHPGYRTGDSPLGEWTASELFTTPGWQEADFRFDVGMAIVAPKSGVTIQDTVGSRGIEFNQDPSGLEFEAFGYPADGKFAPGRKMYRCTSDPGYRDGGGSLAPLAIGCDMTGGSSGGGWVVDGNYVNSVVSYGYNDQPDVLYGPYFGSAIQTLYESAEGTEPGPEPERIDHEIDLTLDFRWHLKARGRMSVGDGYLPCRRNAPIRIYRKRPGAADVFVRATRTGNDGRFSIRLPDRSGRYFAVGPEGEVDELNNCLAATSSSARHRHR